jgi:mannose-6-phosphate isomerase-like protein (cupin superfamily)
VQAPAGAGQPGQELVGAAAGIGADQHPAPQPAGQLGQGQPGGLDVVAGGVRPGVAGPQHDGQRLPAAVAVVGEAGQRVEAPGLLPRGSGLFLVEQAVTIVASRSTVTRPPPAPGAAPPASSQACSRAHARAARIAFRAQGASAASAAISRETIWHVNDGPEVFVVLDGAVDMHYRQHGQERVERLTPGRVCYAEVGDEHVAHSVLEARILVIERKGSV